MASLAQYLSLVTPQHRSAPRFMAALTALLQPFVDQQAFLGRLPAAFDLDEAAGAQLDAVGLWIGETRFLKTPLGGVFFSFGDPALGWGRGRWKGPFDDATGLSRLDDESFRRLLRAKIAANRWDGTLAGAAAALAYIYSDPLTHVFIQDNQDGTISFNVAGKSLSAIDLALLTGGYIPLKPAGVQLAYVNLVSVIGAPLFGFGLDNASVAGFGKGAWGGTITTTATAPSSVVTPPSTPSGPTTTPGAPVSRAFGFGLETASTAGLGTGLWTGKAPVVDTSPGTPGTSGGGGASGSQGGGTGTNTTPSGSDPTSGTGTPGGAAGPITSPDGTGLQGADGTDLTGPDAGATSPATGSGTAATPTSPATPVTPTTTTPAGAGLPFGFGPGTTVIGGFGAGIWTGIAPPVTAGAGSTTPAQPTTTTPADTGTGSGTTPPATTPTAPATTTPTTPTTTPVDTTPTTPPVVTPPAATPPAFGFGAANDSLAGFGTGVWTGKAA